MTQELFDAALKEMRAPAQMGIICVDITNKCDLHCSNCTRLLANQDQFYDMTLENFRLAVRSLRDFPGTIAVIGGNPCMHRDFEGICNVFVEEIPDKSRRGLWTNNVFKYADLAKETFGVFNLNPHNDARGIASLEPLKELGWYYSGHSEHASLLAAVQDFHPPEEMWRLISQCDINQHWSASIVQSKGQLRAYFCEVAASFDLARGEDHGIAVHEGWWRLGLEHFARQVENFCPKCGVPGRIAAFKDADETDSYSRSNADLALKAEKKKKRKIIEIRPEHDVRPVEHRVTQYSTNLHRKKRQIAVITPYYREPEEMLRQCRDSVRVQEVDADILHIMVADGLPNPVLDQWGIEHIRLPRSHQNNGNTPRAIGALLAEAKGVDFIAFLDADNWYHPHHLSSLLALHDATQAEVCCAWRTFHRPDGSLLPITEAGEDQMRHVDTSCYLIAQSAFSANLAWSQMPNEVSAICDRIFLQVIAHRKLRIAFSQQRTVAFRSTYADHYINEAAPESGAHKSTGIANSNTFLMSSDGVRMTVQRLGFWPQP